MTTAIPKTAAELEDWLNDSGKIAESVQDGTFAEIVKAYAASAAPQFTADLQAEVQRSIAAYVKEQRDKGYSPVDLRGDLNSGPQSSAKRNACYNKTAVGAQLDGGYAHIGELASDVWRHRTDKKVTNPEAFEKTRTLSAGYSENDPSSGGFLVPEEVRSNLMQMMLEKSIVRQLATVISMSSLTTKIPFVDATTNIGSVFGGMVFYWIGESQSITPSSAKFGNVKLEANKLVGGARVPNELWADAPALGTWLDQSAPTGMGFYEDMSFVSGNGVDQPLGVLKSNALVQVDKAAATLAASDLYAMYARMLPSSLGSAVWMVNQTMLPELFNLSTGSGGVPLGVVNIANSPVMTILGRPLIVTEKLPAKGADNNIAFVDWSYYLIGDRQAISVDYSEHSRFMNDETEMRIIERVDGRPWVQNPVTPLNGDTLSPYVSLTAS